MNPLAGSPFSEHLGLTVVESSPGRAVISLEITDQLKNRRGDAHGGVTATLLDAALGVACRSHTDDWMSEGTVTLNVQFIEPARGLLLAEGRLLRAGRTVAFVEGEVRNQSGAIVAKATATFKIERRTKATA
ncbi:MAG: PaaI family thioesterase [Candidatus Korobacteraceae bacterium]|jgi:uncharacterized protein (TIGR00369 family)